MYDNHNFFFIFENVFLYTLYFIYLKIKILLFLQKMQVILKDLF